MARQKAKTVNEQIIECENKIKELNEQLKEIKTKIKQEEQNLSDLQEKQKLEKLNDIGKLAEKSGVSIDVLFNAIKDGTILTLISDEKNEMENKEISTTSTTSQTDVTQ